MNQPVPLGEICEFKYGKSLPASKRVVGGVSVYGSNGVVGEHNEGLTKSPAIVIGRKGSIGAISYSSASCWPIDTTYYVDETATSEDVRWLYHALKQLRLDELNKATGVPGLNRNDAYEQRLVRPPLDEQRRIAAILDKADAIRRKREQALALADDLLKSTFLEMFGDPVTNPKGWPVEPLAKFEEFLTSGSRGWAKYYADDGSVFLRIGNIGRNEMFLDDLVRVIPPNNAEAQRTKVQENDLLISITADLGRTAVVPANLAGAHINQHLALVRLAGVSPLYVSAFLASPGGRQQFSRLDRVGVKSGLNFSDIRSLEIPIPTDDMQEKFECFWHRVRSHRAVLRAACSEAEMLFASLSQRAFRGEL